jgi:hypothetical protein
MEWICKASLMILQCFVSLVRRCLPRLILLLPALTFLPLQHQAEFHLLLLDVLLNFLFFLLIEHRRQGLFQLRDFV